MSLKGLILDKECIKSMHERFLRGAGITKEYKVWGQKKKWIRYRK